MLGFIFVNNANNKTVIPAVPPKGILIDSLKTAIKTQATCPSSFLFIETVGRVQDETIEIGKKYFVYLHKLWEFSLYKTPESGGK